MKLGASKPKPANNNTRSVNRVTTNLSRNNNKTQAPKTTASKGPSVNLALDSWNTKTEEKVVKKIEHKNGGSKKNGEKGDFFSDFDDKNEEKAAEEIAEVKEPVVEVKVEDKTEVKEKSPTVEKVVEKPNKEEISENWTNVEKSEVEGDWPTFDDDDVTKTQEAVEKVQPKVMLGATLTSGNSPKPKPATGMFAKKKKKAGFGKKGGSKLGSKRVVVDDFDELEKKAASMKIQPTVKQNIVTTTSIKSTGLKEDRNDRLGMASVGNKGALFSHGISMQTISQEET